MTGRVALVTGGTGALGQTIVHRFLSAGATVWIPYVVEAERQALETALGPAERRRAHFTPADVTDESAMAALVDAASAADGRVDVLVNAVGGFTSGDVVSTSLATWRAVLDLNLTSTFLACRAVLPVMIAARRGRIVNVASRAVVPPQGGFVAYTVAKAAVITLTQALAQEAKPHGIGVNAVLPSTMDTPANRRAMPDADRSSWVSTDAVAAVVAFLASEAAASVTGAAVPV